MRGRSFFGRVRSVTCECTASFTCRHCCDNRPPYYFTPSEVTHEVPRAARPGQDGDPPERGYAVVRKSLGLLLSLLLSQCAPPVSYAQEPGAYWRHSRPATDLPIHIYITTRGPKGCEQFAGCSLGPRWTLKGLAWVLWVSPSRGYSVACTEHHELLHAFGWTHDDTRRPITTEAETCGFHIPLPPGAVIHRFNEAYV